MKNNIRLEDFPNVDHWYGKYYAYNSDTGECAIFNDEKKLLFHKRFSPGGKLSSSALHYTPLPALNWSNGDLLAIGWISVTTNKIIKFGLYNIKTKSYVLPMSKYDNLDITYTYSNNDTIVFFKSDNSLFIIDNDGNLVGKLSKCEYFNRDFYDFDSQTVIVCRERKPQYFCEYIYGVYSCKEKRMILPVEFDKIQNSIFGFIVTKNEQMGIYSYEGEVLTELGCHYIEPLGYRSRTLVKISHNHNTGVFTLDHQCIIPMKYKAIYYHSDEFIIAQNHNLSWTVYSVSKRKPLVPPCIGVEIGKFDKDEVITIRATKYLQLQGHGGYMETADGEERSEHLGCVTYTPYTYSKFADPKFIYYICYDVYSIDGELIKEDVIAKISTQSLCAPYMDSCVPFQDGKSG